MKEYTEEPTNEDILRGIRAVMPENKKATFDELCKETAKVVKAIESGVMLSKNHYGAYLPYVTTKLFFVVLICHGANREGVIAAAKLNGVKLND